MGLMMLAAAPGTSITVAAIGREAAELSTPLRRSSNLLASARPIDRLADLRLSDETRRTTKQGFARENAGHQGFAP